MIPCAVLLFSFLDWRESCKCKPILIKLSTMIGVFKNTWSDLPQLLYSIDCIQIRCNLTFIIYHCVIYRAGAQNRSNMSMSMCGGHAGRLSVWWMWCYRSTKDLCCPIQQGIQDRISSMWRGLWCICVWLPHFCKQERLEPLALTLCWLLYCMGPVWRGRLCAIHFGICLQARLSMTDRQHRGATSAWTH